MAEKSERGPIQPQPEKRKTAEEYGNVPHPKTRADLIAAWQKEKPWQRGLVAVFNHSPETKHTIVKPNKAERKEERISVRDGGKERDTRGWILGELGFSDKDIKSMDPLVAQQLIEKGTGLPSFHVALIDHYTRDKAGRKVNNRFVQALRNPELLADSVSNLAIFSHDIESLTPEQWKQLMKNKEQWEKTNEYLTATELHLAGYDHADTRPLEALRDVIHKAMPPDSRKDRMGMSLIPMSTGILINHHPLDKITQNARRLLVATKINPEENFGLL